MSKPDQVTEGSRRKLLKSLAAGSGAVVAGKSLPESWVRPAVDSVLLPAHAQTSAVSFSVSGLASNDKNSLEELLIPTAHANLGMKNICMNATGSSVSVQVMIDGLPGLYTGTFSLPFGLQELTPDSVTTFPVSISGELTADGSAVSGEILAGETSSNYTAPKSTGSCQLTADEAKFYAIGDTGPCGGKVFYITNGGLNGLEAAPTDQGKVAWGCVGIVTGVTGTAIGTGAANTSAIVALGRCSVGSAAELASNYTLGGCSGWYLPSQDELNELYMQKAVVDGFANNYYWSSSEDSANIAWVQSFINGDKISTFGRLNTFYVRAVRSF